MIDKELDTIYDLYRNYKYLGQNYEQLVLPVNRRQEVMRLAHEIYAGHLGAKKTKKKN